MDARQHVRELADAREAVKRRSVERIEAEVDAVEAGLREIRGHRTELYTVRRQYDLLDARHALDVADETHEAAPYERLAAREAHLAHAELRESPHDAQDFVKRQDILMAQFLHTLRRHAVLTAQVAAVGQ